LWLIKLSVEKCREYPDDIKQRNLKRQRQKPRRTSVVVLRFFA
jgi:hypothetical protein